MPGQTPPSPLVATGEALPHRESVVGKVLAAEMTGSRRDHYLPTFDCWRAVAALLVILAHTMLNSAPFSFAPYLKIQQFIIKSSVLGVYIFFALSGFLITYLILVERHTKGSFNLQRFWLRRICRIVPLVYVYLAFLLAFGAIAFPLITYKEVLPVGLFYYNCYVTASGYTSWFLTHLWSLSIEMQFYLAWSLILSATHCRFTLRLALWGALSFAAIRGYLAIHGYHGNTICGDTLLWGAFFGTVYFDKDGRSILKTCLSPAALPGLLALQASVIYFQPTGYLCIEALLFGLLVSGTLVNASHLCFRWMEWSLLLWLGRISYSIYIWQEVFTAPGRVGSHAGWGRLFTLPISLIWILPVAWISFELIELPFMRLGSRLARRMESPS